MKYNEEKNSSKSYKEIYVNGLEYTIEKLQRKAEIYRKEYTKDLLLNQEKYREELKKMLGWPLVGFCTDDLAKAESKMLYQENGYKIYRMQFEILEGLKMTGLFFKQDGVKEKPLVILQHGGCGTPELISGIYGSTGNYNDMLQRVIKHEVHVFAPQFLLWADEYEVEFNRVDIDGRLKRVGSSIAAIELFGITRILDFFEQKKYISSFGMVGLSYGGFYALYAAAIDTRIKSAISCSFFNKRDAVGWTDWTWFKSAEKFDDAEIACLIYPRKLCIEIGDKDDLFDYKNGVESFEKIKMMCKNVGTAWMDFKVFSGSHEFCLDDEPIQKLINDIKMQ